MCIEKLRRLLGWTMVLTLVLGLAAVGGVVAQSADRESLADYIPVSGTLAGNRAGAFAYYTIDYPGDLRVVTIEMRFMPNDPLTSSGVGFNVYAPGGYVIGQGKPNRTADGGLLKLRYSDNNPATWLVQVYNYLPDRAISYTIEAQGLPVSPESSASGTLLGKHTGRFEYYTIEYPGDHYEMTIELEFVPADPIMCKGVGFSVFGPGVSLVDKASLHYNGEKGVWKLVYSDDNEASLVVQVHNYIPSRAVSYTILARGLPLSLGAPTPTLTPEIETETEADVESVTRPTESGSGSLGGNRAGAYAVYDLNYAGDGSEVTVMMTFTPDNPVISKGVGFVIYGPSGEVARGKSTSRPAERKATFSTDEPGVYTLQVYNYIDGVTILYAITTEY